MKNLLLTLTTLFALTLAVSAPAHAKDPLNQPSDATSQSVQDTWQSVDGEFNLDGVPVAVSIDRASQEAYLIENAGTAHPLRFSPRKLSKSLMARLETIVSKAKVVGTSKFMVGQKKVASQNLRGLLETVAHSVQRQGEPAEREISGQVVEYDHGLYLHTGSQRIELRGMDPKLEQAASRMSKGTFKVLLWPAKSGQDPLGMITGITSTPNAVQSDWKSVGGEITVDGVALEVSVDRETNEADVIENPGTRHALRTGGRKLSATLMSRLNTVVGKAKVVAKSKLSVGDKKVTSESLRGVLEAVARTVQREGEPTEKYVSGEVVEYDHGLYLHTGSERIELRGLRPKLEKAASLLKEGTFQVLHWPAKAAKEPLGMITGIYLEATKESKPEGVKPGEKVKVTGLDEAPTELVKTPNGSRLVGGTTFKIQDEAGNKGVLKNPRRALKTDMSKKTVQKGMTQALGEQSKNKK